MASNVFPPSLRETRAPDPVPTPESIPTPLSAPTPQPVPTPQSVSTRQPAHTPEPPPSYEDVVDAESPTSAVRVRTSVASFAASTVGAAGIVSNSLTEPLAHVDFTDGPFSGQIQRANSWLTDHPSVRVISCETVELPRDNDGYSFGDSNNIGDRSCFHLRVASNVQFIRFLRLWTVPRLPNQEEKPQQLSYYDVVPKQKPVKSKVFGKDKLEFESLQDTVLRFNGTLKAEPLPGRIVNIQTCEVKFRDKAQPGFDKFDENYYTWVREEKHSPQYRYLTFLRIFHETTHNADTRGYLQQIGYVDFSPKQIEDKSVKDFEPLQQPASRIQNWVNENQDKLVLNIQTVDYKFSKSPGSKFEAETSRSLFKENDTGDIRHLSVLRLNYVQFLDPAPSATYPLVLTYKTFCPAKTTRESKSNPPHYENMAESWKRTLAWLSVTGVRIFGAETVFVRSYPSKNSVYGEHEASFVDSRPEWVEFWLAGVRVYFNGTYTEPPAHLLPLYPILPPEETKSCVLM